jgi:hypothetical protein
MSTTPAPDHRDFFDRPLAVNDYVVYPSYNTMMVGTVTRLTPKMALVKSLGSGWRSESRKYPQELVQVAGPEVTMYVLKKSAVSK